MQSFITPLTIFDRAREALTLKSLYSGPTVYWILTGVELAPFCLSYDDMNNVSS